MTSSAKKKILITGGLGFIGGNIIKRLHGEYNFVVIDNDNSPATKKFAKKLELLGIKVWKYNIADFRYWEEVEPCDYIIHAAAQTAAERSKEEPFDDFRSNALGTIRIAEFARRTKASVIYCNSIRVYDSIAIDEITSKCGAVGEDCQTVTELAQGTPPFAFSKYIGEQYLRYYSNNFGIKVISLRMSGIVGPGQNSSEIHGWVSNIVRCAKADETYKIFGDGNQTRDILHVDDFVDLIEIQIKQFSLFSDDGFSVYNVGGGKKNEFSINQIINILEGKFGLKLTYRKKEPRIGEPRSYCSNIDKIKDKGWPLTELKSAEEIISSLVTFQNN